MIWILIFVKRSLTVSKKIRKVYFILNTWKLFFKNGKNLSNKKKSIDFWEWSVLEKKLLKQERLRLWSFWLSNHQFWSHFKEILTWKISQLHPLKVIQLFSKTSRQKYNISPQKILSWFKNSYLSFKHFLWFYLSTFDLKEKHLKIIFQEFFWIRELKKKFHESLFITKKNEFRVLLDFLYLTES